MDKITVIPGSVRGYGDVVSPKTLEDFEVFDSELSFEDGLYTLVYDASGVSVGLSVSSGSISVGESVVCTAEVLSGGEPVSGETVSFYDGSTLLGTDETDSDGLATYTASSLTVGSHSLTAQALDKSSSAVTVTVNKLTSTITLSVPASGTVGTSYSITGTLVPTSGSVKLYENGSLKDTLTVSSGSFSKAITQSNEGTYSYYAVFEGSSTYSSVTSSTGSIVVSDVPPVPVVTSVSLTGDKSILSYADSESTVLTATVLDENDDPVEGVTVNLYNGATLWDTLTTDSSGECTKTYSSAGVGDITFTAEVDGTLLTKTYGIEDCLVYDSLTSSSGKWTIPSGVSSDYTSNGWKATSSSYKQIKLTDKLTSDCSVEFTLSDYSNTQYTGIIIYAYTNGESTPNQAILLGGTTNTSNRSVLGTSLNRDFTKGAVYRIEYTSSTLKVYENGTLLGQASSSVGLPTRFEFHISDSRWAIYKDLKVKPL